MQTFVGEGTLFVQKAWDDPVDDPSQPRMHDNHGPDDLWIKITSTLRPEEDWVLVYKIMQEGYRSINPCLYMHEAFPEADVYPGTAHDVELCKRGQAYLEDFYWWFWHQTAENCSGPFDLPIGESLGNQVQDLSFSLAQDTGGRRWQGNPEYLLFSPGWGTEKPGTIGRAF